MPTGRPSTWHPFDAMNAPNIVTRAPSIEPLHHQHRLGEVDQLRRCRDETDVSGQRHA